MRIIIIFLFFTSLVACSSPPVKTKLYSLSLPAPLIQQKVQSTLKLNRPILQISHVKMADYLSNRNLVMQVNAYEIKHANYHLWAEDLDQAIAKNLLDNLKPLEHDFLLVRHSDFQETTARYRLHLQFEAFHATYQSQVIAKGKYWVLDNKDKLIFLNDFSYSLALEQDGYLHSVAKLKEALSKLAKDIIQDVEQSMPSGKTL